jgi:hypothetical protein
MIFYSTANQVVKDSISKIKTSARDRMYEHQDMCIDYYQYNNTQSYIAEYFAGTLQEEIPLYCVNMTKRLIDRISLVYKNKPTRQIEDERYQDLIIDKDFTLKRIERIHNLLGTIALQVVWNDGKFNYIPRLEFEPVFDYDDPMNPIGIVYPVQRAVDSLSVHGTDEFVYWDKEQHFKFDSNGKVEKINEDNVNPYGILPFVFIQPNSQVDEFINVGRGKDIATANQQVDIAMTMLQHHIRKAGGQYVIEGNVETNNIELGLNKVVVIDDGNMTNLNPNVNINEIMEGIKFQLQQVAINHHLTFDFGLSGSKSGVALKIENLELLEAREDDVEKFNRLEKDIYSIEKAIADSEDNLSLPDDFTINFTEIEFPDFEKEREEWDWKFFHGIADVIDYMMFKDPDGFPTREDAEQYLAERRVSNSNVKNGATQEKSIFKFGKNTDNDDIAGNENNKANATKLLNEFTGGKNGKKN